MRRTPPHRKIRHWLTVVLVGLGLVAVAGPAEAQSVGTWLTSPGKAAAELLADTLSAPPGFVIGVRDLKFKGLDRVTLVGVTFSDAQGVWAEAPEVRLKWHPKRLLSRQVSLDDLEIPALDLKRMPAGGRKNGNGFTLAWPSPGVEIVVKAARATITTPGAAQPLKVSGSLAWTRGVLKTDIKAAGGTESVLARLDIEQASKTVAVDVDAVTSPGKPLAKIMGIGAMGGRLQIKGGGAPEDWSGQMLAALPEGDRITGAVRRVADEDGKIRFVLSGDAKLTASGLGHADVPSDIAPGLVGSYAVTGDFVFSGPELDRIALSLKGVRADVDLVFAPPTAPDVLALDLKLKDDAVLAPALGDFKFTAARLNGDFNLAGPTRFDGTVRFEHARSGEITAAVLEGRLHADFPDMGKPNPRISFTGQGSGARVSVPGAGQPLSIPALTWKITGQWPDGGRVITLENITVDGGPLHATGHATITTGSGDFDMTGNVVFDDLSAVRGEILEGRYDGPFRLVGNAKGFALSLDGRVDGLKAANPLVAAIAGKGALTFSFEQPRAAAGAALPAGRLTARLAGTAVTLDAAARFADPAAVDAKLGLTVTDSTAVSAALGLKLAKSSRVDVQLSGALASPDIDLRAEVPTLGAAATRLEKVKLHARLKDVITAPAGRIDVAAEAVTGQVSGSATIASPDATHITASDVVLDTSLARLTGGFTYDRAADLLTGGLKGESSDIATLQNTLDVEGAGRFALDLAFKSEDAHQVIALTVSGQKVSTVLADRQAVTADALDVSGRMRLPRGLRTLGDPEALNIESHLGQLRAGALSLDNVTFKANGLTATVPYKLSATGDFFGAIDLSSAGTIDLSGKGYKVVIDSLAGTLAGRPLKLEAPVTYRRRTDGRSMTPMALTYGDGRIDMVYNADRDDQMLRLDIEETDAGLVPLFLPIPPITGALDTRLALDVKDGKASGYGTIAARDIRLRAGDDKNFPVDAALAVELDGDILRLSGRIDGPTLKADLAGAVPVTVDPARSRVAFAATRPIEATLDWQGGIDPIVAVLPPMDQSFDGKLNGSLKISGTLDNPEFAGRLALKDGSYENYAFGSRFVNLAGELAFGGNKVRLLNLTGADLNGGRLTGEGEFTLDPAQHYPGALTLTFKNLRPLALDAATATTSGTLTYERTPNRATLKGTLDADKAELRLADKLPTEVTTLDVIEVNGAGEKVDEPQAAPATIPPARPLIEALDVDVNSSGRIFVRGRGLDSEWRGDMHITGTPAVPRIAGTLELVRGTFAFAGRQLNLTKGRLQFTGGDHIDPYLELTGVYDTASLTANVDLNGPLSAPKITLSSTPALPEDEIMARILFGTSVQELSAVEAVQLGSAVASLSGSGGLDVFSKARSMLGLDRLTVESDGQTTNGRLVTGGKYLTNNVYLEVQTRTDTGESNATVRLDITRNLQVESDVGSDNSSTIGLRWKKDY